MQARNDIGDVIVVIRIRQARFHAVALLISAIVFFGVSSNISSLESLMLCPIDEVGLENASLDSSEVVVPSEDSSPAVAVPEVTEPASSNELERVPLFFLLDYGYVDLGADDKSQIARYLERCSKNKALALLVRPSIAGQELKSADIFLAGLQELGKLESRTIVINAKVELSDVSEPVLVFICTP